MHLATIEFVDARTRVLELLFPKNLSGRLVAYMRTCAVIRGLSDSDDVTIIGVCVP